MFVYSVTVGIDQDIEFEWVQWMKEEHIPLVMATGLFIKHKMFRVLSQEENNISYSIQYYSESLNDIENYLENHAQDLIQHHNDRYKNKHVAFRVLLEQIE